MEQRSDEWFKARLGKVTASAVADVMAKTKSGYGASRANLMAKLITERLTGQPAESYTNGAMQWGIDNEDTARAAVAFYLGQEIHEVGFIEHPTIMDFGASPDGLIGSDGMLEIKCPNTATHLAYLRERQIPQKYLLQMQTQMVCADRKWNLFVSFDPRLPIRLQMFSQRVERDNDLIAEIESEVQKFLREMQEYIDELDALYPE